MPPTAAETGSNAFFRLDSSPTSISRFISSPTIKKNIKETRMIRMEIGMPDKLYKVEKPNYSKFDSRMVDDENLPKFLRDMLKNNIYI